MILMMENQLKRQYKITWKLGKEGYAGIVCISSLYTVQPGVSSWSETELCPNWCHLELETLGMYGKGARIWGRGSVLRTLEEHL